MGSSPFDPAVADAPDDDDDDEDDRQNDPSDPCLVLLGLLRYHGRLAHHILTPSTSVARGTSVGGETFTLIVILVYGIF